MLKNSDLREGDGSVDGKEEMVLRHFKNKMNGLDMGKGRKREESRLWLQHWIQGYYSRRLVFRSMERSEAVSQFSV